jgi:hypothetical protein
MLRVLSFLGLALLFLVISPGLRGHLMGGLVAFVGMMVKYSPFSYVVGVLVLFLTFVISVYRGSRPR